MAKRPVKQTTSFPLPEEWSPTQTPSRMALFGGNISGRRLRGVKINPIYQENDVTSRRQGDAADTQSESALPIGEIQIEMYESLPRNKQRHFRLYNSAPVLKSPTKHMHSAPGPSYSPQMQHSDRDLDDFDLTLDDDDDDDDSLNRAPPRDSSLMNVNNQPWTFFQERPHTRPRESMWGAFRDSNDCPLPDVREEGANTSHDPQGTSRDPQDISRNPQEVSQDSHNLSRDVQDVLRGTEDLSHDPQCLSRISQDGSHDQKMAPEICSPSTPSFRRLPSAVREEPDIEELDDNEVGVNVLEVSGEGEPPGDHSPSPRHLPTEDSAGSEAPNTIYMSHLASDLQQTGSHSPLSQRERAALSVHSPRNQSPLSHREHAPPEEHVHGGPMGGRSEAHRTLSVDSLSCIKLCPLCRRKLEALLADDSPFIHDGSDSSGKSFSLCGSTPSPKPRHFENNHHDVFISNDENSLNVGMRITRYPVHGRNGFSVGHSSPVRFQHSTTKSCPCSCHSKPQSNSTAELKTQTSGDNTKVDHSPNEQQQHSDSDEILPTIEDDPQNQLSKDRSHVSKDQTKDQTEVSQGHNDPNNLSQIDDFGDEVCVTDCENNYSCIPNREKPTVWNTLCKIHAYSHSTDSDCSIPKECYGTEDNVSQVSEKSNDSIFCHKCSCYENVQGKPRKDKSSSIEKHNQSPSKRGECDIIHRDLGQSVINTSKGDNDVIDTHPGRDEISSSAFECEPCSAITEKNRATRLALNSPAISCDPDIIQIDNDVIKVENVAHSQGENEGHSQNDLANYPKYVSYFEMCENCGSEYEVTHVEKCSCPEMCRCSQGQGRGSDVRVEVTGAPKERPCILTNGSIILRVDDLSAQEFLSQRYLSDSPSPRLQHAHTEPNISVITNSASPDPSPSPSRSHPNLHGETKSGYQKNHAKTDSTAGDSTKDEKGQTKDIPLINGLINSCVPCIKTDADDSTPKRQNSKTKNGRPVSSIEDIEAEEGGGEGDWRGSCLSNSVVDRNDNYKKVKVITVPGTTSDPAFEMIVPDDTYEEESMYSSRRRQRMREMEQQGPWKEEPGSLRDRIIKAAVCTLLFCLFVGIFIGVAIHFGVKEVEDTEAGNRVISDAGSPFSVHGVV